jgi:hypothetical protein
MVATLTSVSFTPPAPQARVDSAFPRRCAVIDGLNVIRTRGKDSPQFELLVDVTLRLVRDGYDALVISDANTWYELRKYQGELVAGQYEAILRSLPNHFAESPAGIKADPLILAEANARDAFIVSCDHFKQYIRRYAWIQDRSRFLQVAALRRHYYLGECRCAIPSDIQPSLRELVARLTRLRHCA